MGRPDDAYRELHRIFDPAEMAYHPYMRLLMFGLWPKRPRSAAR